MLVFAASSLYVLYTLRLSLVVEVGLLISLAPLIGFYFYLRKYHIYGAGWEGEKRVAKLLSGKLSDDYFLLNDLYLRNGEGDIDHVILAPAGIFVLETKNWRGEITCNGDTWVRSGKNSFKGSPSRQAKRNAATIKHIVDSSPSLRQLGISVEGIVVFTNNHAALHLNNPTVLVLKLQQLPNQIATQGSFRRYSSNNWKLSVKKSLNKNANEHFASLGMAALF